MGKSKQKIYRSLFTNKNLLMLWSGQTVSLIGDAFYDIAVIWLVFDQTKSVFLSALVGVLFHLSSALLSPFAGVYADRFDRKKVVIVTHILSALVVFMVGILYFIFGYLPIILAFITIVVLNGLSTFLYPAESSILPTIVSKNLLSGAYGVFQTIAQSASLIGNALAGLLIAAIGTGWALAVDGLSFVMVALFIGCVQIPHRPDAIATQKDEKRPSMWSDLTEGFKHIMGMPVIRSLVWLFLLINIASFIGPLYVPLIELQLHGGPAVFGFLEVSGIIGGILGGLAAGFFERRFGAGRLVGLFWASTGICTIGIGFSTSIALTLSLFFIEMFINTIAGVCIYAVLMALISEQYRGRVNGIIRSIAVIAIPISTLIAGGLGEVIDISYLFAIAGLWNIGVGILALANRYVRNAEVDHGDGEAQQGA